jgi:ankyrin repeat protein
MPRYLTAKPCYLAAETNDPDLAGIFDGGTTPLHRAAAKNHLAIAKWLLRAGADPKARDAAGKTAIELAREKEHEKVVEAIESGP